MSIKRANQPSSDAATSPVDTDQQLGGALPCRTSLPWLAFERSTCTELAPVGSEWYQAADQSLIGLLSRPDASKYSTPKGRIVIFGGSGGGVERALCAHFASLGLLSFGIGYHLGGFSGEPGKELPPHCSIFKIPDELKVGLPPHLESINLDKLNGAVEWFRNSTPSVDEKIMICGVSRGAELALILASIFPETFSKVIALLPSSAIHGAYSWTDTSVWQSQAPGWVRGEDNAPYYGEQISDQWRFGHVAVKDITASVLAMSFKDDEIWGPSWYKSPKDWFNAEEILKPRGKIGSGDVAILHEGKHHDCYPPAEMTNNIQGETELQQKMAETWKQIESFIETDA